MNRNPALAIRSRKGGRHCLIVGSSRKFDPGYFSVITVNEGTGSAGAM
jgi:hypothetical protein